MFVRNVYHPFVYKLPNEYVSIFFDISYKMKKKKIYRYIDTYVCIYFTCIINFTLCVLDGSKYDDDEELLLTATDGKH